MAAKTYHDKAKCPKGHKFVVPRRIGTAGKTVRTYCRVCDCAYQIKAGQAPEGAQP